MPTKAERLAWESLKKAYPGRKVSLELQYDNFGNTGENVFYQAYIAAKFAGMSGQFSDSFKTPGEAVADVIKKEVSKE
jgi:hypothetical protein